VRARTWLAVICALLAIPASAAAHAEFASAGRTDGGTARLLFSAPIEAAFARAVATTPDGTEPSQARRDPDDDHALLVDVPETAIALGWRVLSRDGHVTSGVSPLAPSSTVVVVRESARARGDGLAMIAGRSLLFAGVLGLIGMLAFRFAVVGPAWRSGGPRPPGAGDPEPWRRATDASIRTAMPAWWRVWWVLVGLAAAGLAVSLVAMVGLLDAGPGDVGTLLADTRWGVAWIVQVVGVLSAACLAAALLLRRDAALAPSPATGWGVAIGIPLAAAGVAISWSGHAASGTDASLGTAIDAVHLVGSGLWLGGLAALLAIVPLARRELDEPSALRLSAAVVVRFSSVAIACVGVLVVTGVYRALAELRSFSDLIDTGYGRALLVKLVIFAVLLIGGAYNRLVLHPRLERAALGLRIDDGGAADRLRISVAAEIAVATAVIVAVAVLVTLPPP
jgi:putative copper export protein/methionine-rich copper-binding protein CopC